MDVGRDYAHFGLLYPFADRPDQSVRVLWFPVPLDRPNVLPPTPFVLRNWDRMEGLEETRPGAGQDVLEYYYGPLPINPPGKPCGTPQQWLGQIDYATWLGGGYSCNCPGPILPIYVSSVTCDDGSIDVAPTTGDVVLHIDTSHTNVWEVEQDFNALVKIDVSTLANYIALEIVGNVGSGAADVLQIISNGLHQLLGRLRINGAPGVGSEALWVRPGHNQDGVRVLIPGSTTTRPLSLEKGGGAVQFAIDTDGQILTNQTQAATTPGSVVAALAVYDDTGALVGYLPVYDTIT